MRFCALVMDGGGRRWTVRDDEGQRWTVMDGEGRRQEVTVVREGRGPWMYGHGNVWMGGLGRIGMDSDGQCWNSRGSF